MSKLAPLPFTITPFTLEDANQVQGNFQSIVTQVNDLTDVSILGTPTTLVSGAFTVLQRSGSPPYNDVNSEISGNTFVPTTTGIYAITGSIQVTASGSTTGISGTTITIGIFRNGSDIQSGGSVSWPYADSLARFALLPVFNTVSLIAADVVDLRLEILSFSGTAPTAFFGLLNYRRIA